ncbi:hypothetical protein CRUP_018088, partial [Coryphaenoides rupestris]
MHHLELWGCDESCAEAGWVEEGGGWVEEGGGWVEEGRGRGFRGFLLAPLPGGSVLTRLVVLAYSGWLPSVRNHLKVMGGVPVTPQIRMSVLPSETSARLGTTVSVAWDRGTGSGVHSLLLNTPSFRWLLSASHMNWPTSWGCCTVTLKRACRPCRLMGLAGLLDAPDLGDAAVVEGVGRRHAGEAPPAELAEQQADVRVHGVVDVLLLELLGHQHLAAAGEQQGVPLEHLSGGQAQPGGREQLWLEPVAEEQADVGVALDIATQAAGDVQLVPLEDLLPGTHLKDGVSVAAPRISVVGRVVLGKPFEIQCVSEDGSLPINYTLWRNYEPMNVSATISRQGRQARFSVTVQQPQEVGQFMCEADNSQRKEGVLSKRLNASVIVPLSQATLTVVPSLADVSEGNTLILICGVTGTPPITFKWFRTDGSQPLYASTTNRVSLDYQIPRIGRDDSATYYCEALNLANNTVHSQWVTVE